MIFLDTHIVLWLFDGRVDLFDQEMRQLIDEEELYISPMVGLELTYLEEIERISVSPASVVKDLEIRIGLGISEISFVEIVEAAKDLSWTRDPFDRLIVAHAISKNSRLITADSTIQEYFKDAVWR